MWVGTIPTLPNRPWNNHDRLQLVDRPSEDCIARSGYAVHVQIGKRGGAIFVTVAKRVIKMLCIKKQILRNFILLKPLMQRNYSKDCQVETSFRPFDVYFNGASICTQEPLPQMPEKKLVVCSQHIHSPWEELFSSQHPSTQQINSKHVK